MQAIMMIFILQAERQITVAEEFINLVEKYCEKQLD